MPVVRVYLPVGRDDLVGLATTGVLTAAPGSPRSAYAATSGLRDAAPGEDAEDLEYTAYCDAVDAAALVRATGDRRVVLSADADPGWVVERGGSPVTQVLVTAGIPMARVAAFHVDEERGAQEDADELLWYDATELDEVRRLLG